VGFRRSDPAAGGRKLITPHDAGTFIFQAAEARLSQRQRLTFCTELAVRVSAQNYRNTLLLHVYLWSVAGYIHLYIHAFDSRILAGIVC
jgi:hypothetical protein